MRVHALKRSPRPGPGGAVLPVLRAQREQEHLQGGPHAVRAVRGRPRVLRAERHPGAGGAVPARQPLQPGHGAGAAHAGLLGLYQVVIVYL